MKKFGYWILVILILFNLIGDIYQALAVCISLFLFREILISSNHRFVFRELALLLYAINYLIAPTITYNLNLDGLAKLAYGMKITSDQYFKMAIPGYICFAFGMFSIRTKIFKMDFTQFTSATILNTKTLISTTIFGLVLNIVSTMVFGGSNFFFHLLSLIRFVSAFALFSINRNKYWFWLFFVLFLELFKGFISGMYHDAIIWLIFFALYFVYTSKPSFRFKFVGSLVLTALVLFIQAIKHNYRADVWYGEKKASFRTVFDVGAKQANSAVLLGTENLLSTLERGNQAWIFASTVDNMDRNKNFQGLTNVNKYLEAAILPRFLAPNKIKSGDREIFNQFSGHTIKEGTSMGLGIFADGYVAYGSWGVYIFGFALGLIFSLTFKLVERWTKVSPFHVLLLLPLLS